MSVQVLCIGTELLVGDCVNTNLAYIGYTLDQAGIVVERESTIPDDPDIMRAALRQALAESQLVITIGGLGPTQDDRTRAIVSEVLDQPLALDTALADAIRTRYLGRNRVVADYVWNVQAMVPRGGVPLPNEYGTAPGLWCTKDGRAVLLLPGPPRELQAIFAGHAMPRILASHPPQVKRHTLAIFGLGESVIEGRTIQVLKPWPEVDPAYSIKPGKCHVRLTVRADQGEILDLAVAALQAEFGAAASPITANPIGAVIDLLRARKLTLATAESCTGGGIAGAITDEAGVSDVYLGSLVTYANAAKIALLGVDPALLDPANPAAPGAVSSEVAAAMAHGAASRLGATAAIAVTGIAGPTGGTPAKPVGLVYIATVVNGDLRVSENNFRGNRAAVRDRTGIVAIQQLRQHLDSLPA